MSVKNILSFFRLIIWLLDRVENGRNKDVTSINDTMTALIIKREAATVEAAKAAKAKRKIKELVA